MTRSDITTIRSACLTYPCEGHLRTVVGYCTSQYPQLQELPPQRIWIGIVQRLTRHPLTVIPGVISVDGYLYRVFATQHDQIPTYWQKNCVLKKHPLLVLDLDAE